MSEEFLPVEAGGGARSAPDFLEKTTGSIAVAGGLLSLAVAVLVTTSVLMRWLFNAPIDGDFEYVKMAVAVSIFAFLPYTQARRGNMVVDTFTTGLSDASRNRIDAFWDIAYVLAALFCAYALFTGTLEAARSGETTMQRQLLIWPSIALSALLCTVLSITAVLTARKLLMLDKRTVQS